MNRTSLQGRLLLTATAILVVFLGLTGVVLDKAFRASAESALQGRLQGQLYGLLGAAELGPEGELAMQAEPAEARFSRPGSGLVAQVVTDRELPVWLSSSALGIELPQLNMLAVDESDFRRIDTAQQSWFAYAYGLAWLDEKDIEHHYTFRILESTGPFNAQLGAFRKTLVTWLSAAALFLLLLQGIILRWGLAPIRRIEAEVHEIERGDRTLLHEDYPRELNGLAASLNLLIGNERRHLERYRHSLADLAHSMKTPLAVLRGASDSEATTSELHSLIDEQVQRMDDIVEYQLQKAATAGTASLTRGVNIAEVVGRLVRTLEKVYHDKGIRYQSSIDADALFYGEHGDLMEMLGNLLDNASKWCRSNVSITVTSQHDNNWRKGVVFVITDDGPGLDMATAQLMMQRGARGDTQVPGHGIGLAVVHELVQAYAGQLDITAMDGGGTRISIDISYR